MILIYDSTKVAVIPTSVTAAFYLLLKNEGIVHMCFFVDNVQEEFERINKLGYNSFKIKNGEIVYKVEDGYLLLYVDVDWMDNIYIPHLKLLNSTQNHIIIIAIQASGGIGCENRRAGYDGTLESI